MSSRVDYGKNPGGYNVHLEIPNQDIEKGRRERLWHRKHGYKS